jgi:TFIIF-interacting CTD phosphatase-like protein
MKPQQCEPPLYLVSLRQDCHATSVFKKAFQDTIERHLRKPLLPPSLKPLLPSTDKPTLVLSLDGCLLEASIQEKAITQANQFILGYHTVTVTLRPYIQDFLASVGAHFDLVLWSCQQQAFTESVLAALPEVRKHFSAVLD